MKFAIVYGSVMGTAESVAESLFETLSGQHNVNFLSPSDASRFSPDEILIIVTSNTGMGDLPANILPFYHFLLQPNQPLHTLKYLVVNLGDSSYPNFGQAGATLNDTLCDLGAQPLTGMCTIDAIFDDTPDTTAVNWVNAWLATQQ